MHNTLFLYDNFYDESARLRLPVGTVYQAAELCITTGGDINLHNQICDEITVVLSGSGRIVSGDEQAVISGGQVHYIKKGVNHAIAADDNFRYICIGFELNRDSEDTRDFLNVFSEKNSLILNDNGIIRQLSELLLGEVYNMTDKWETMINMYLCQILISLLRLEKSTQVNVEKKRPDFTVYSVIRLIDTEYMNIKSVGDIARRLSYSEYYISHLFRKKLDMTIKEYVLGKKLAAAPMLLTDKNMTVGETAEYLGFSSTHTFSTAFKKRFGISPMRYKQQKNDSL